MHISALSEPVSCLHSAGPASTGSRLFVFVPPAERCFRHIHPLLIRGNDQDVSKAIRSSGGTLIRQYGNITRADLNPEQINTLRQETGILWIDCPQGNFRLMNDVMIHHNNADSAQQGYWPLPQGYDGTGVIIGVIDAPFDYRHGDFTDAEGNTRIKYLWDQSQAPDGTEPCPMVTA